MAYETPELHPAISTEERAFILEKQGETAIIYKVRSTRSSCLSRVDIAHIVSSKLKRQSLKGCASVRASI